MIPVQDLDLELWESHIEVPSRHGCWFWTGGVNDKNYGRCYINRKSFYAHRVSYELYIGPIPDDLEVDHMCRNTLCVNPRHLRLLTTYLNKMRGSSHYLTDRNQCPKGHEYDSKYRNHRRCSVCQRAYMKEYNKRRKNETHNSYK